MSGNFRSSLRRCVDLPQASHYTLHDAHVPLACLLGEDGAELSLDADIDSLVNVVRHSILFCCAFTCLGIGGGKVCRFSSVSCI